MFAMPTLFAGNKVNPAIFQAALSRFFRRATQRKAFARPPQRRKILFESLEPRLLLSADFPIAPLGSLVHEVNEVGSLVAVDSTVSHTLSLDAGQKISVVFNTEDPDLQGTIELYGPNGTTLLGSDTADGIGGAALLDSVVVGAAGNYRLDVRNSNGLGDGGDYSLDILLNATVEAEEVGGAANDALVGAQDLAPSELLLPGGGLRYAAVGTAQVGSADYFRLDLAVDELASFGLASLTLTDTRLQLDLLDGSGNLLAIGDATASNFDRVIQDFAATAAGTYYLRVSSDVAVDYTLLAVRNTRLDVEPSDTASYARVLSPLDEAVGSLGRKESGGTGAIRVAVLADSEVRTIAQLNDDSYYDFTAIRVSPTDIDTLGELNNYDVVLLGARQSTDGTVENTMAAALRAWVEAGHGVVETGWGVYYDGLNTPPVDANIDAIVPINLNTSRSYSYSPTITITNDGHPVTAGVTSFSGSSKYAEWGTAGIDSGASTLATVSGYPAVVVGTPALGRGVYLSPVYPTYDWGTGMADRLLEQAVAWAAFGGVDREDNYLVAVNAGDALSISTTTPGGLPLSDPLDVLSPANSLDPLLELYDPAGILVASNNNGAADARNALIGYTAASAGTYRLRVAGVTGMGDYSLEVQGASGALANTFAATGASVMEGAMLAAFPGSIDIAFSQPVRMDSVSPLDVMVIHDVSGPVAVSDAILVNANTVRYVLAEPLASDGNYFMMLPVGAVANLANDGTIAEYALAFAVDATAPYVVSHNLEGGVVPEPGPFTFSADFSEALDEEVLDVSDVLLVETLSGQAISPVSFNYDLGSNHLDIDFGELAEGRYTLTLFSQENGFRDTFGNPLDGDGDGVAGGDFVVDFGVDSDVVAFPTPLDAWQPAGSLIHDGEVAGALYHPAGVDTDTYTLDLDANQMLTIALFPMDAGLKARVEVIGPSGSLGAYEATTPGAVAALNHLWIEDAGTYFLVLSNLEEGGELTAGHFNLSVLLNAAGEAEDVGFGGNDDLGSAQNLTSAFIQFDNGAGLASVAGSLETPEFVLTSPPKLLGTLGHGGTLSTLVELDPETGAVTRTIGEVGYAINGLEYDASRSILYGAVSNNDPRAAGYLVSIDLNTGAGTPIGEGAGVGILLNVTSDSMGNLYAWTESSDDLVALDPVTGAGYVVGESGLSTSTHSLAFDADDKLWFVNSGGGFYLVDPITGGTSYQFGLDLSAAHHGDFNPLTGLFYGVGSTDDITSMVVIDVANQTVLNSFDTGVQLHTVSFTAGDGYVVPSEDWYRFDLMAGESVTLSLSYGDEFADHNINLELYDDAGNLIALAHSGDANVGRTIQGFMADADATYHVSVSGDTQGDYSLVLSRDQAFGLETGAAQELLAGRVVGALDSGADTDSYLVRVANDG
ncbi:MAG: pre-peptidase C-terminal domain-containing protein, partial [Gammaproteobacteria bacterium]|nr:pre-peptidase C-terminal domain-containing protein [Gammaproteobacteria bacterium]